MKWHDLPKRAQVELSNLIPDRYQDDVIRDNPEALAKVFRLIRNQWQECEKILEEEGERGLAKERDRVAKQMEELERGPAYLRQRLRELNCKLAQETHRHGWEDGRKATPAEVAAVSDYAAHLVEEWMRYEKMRQDGYLLDRNEQMHHRRIRLSIIKEVLHRKENFLPTEVPDFVQEALPENNPFEGTTKAYSYCRRVVEAWDTLCKKNHPRDEMKHLWREVGLDSVNVEQAVRRVLKKVGIRAGEGYEDSNPQSFVSAVEEVLDRYNDLS